MGRATIMEVLGLLPIERTGAVIRVMPIVLSEKRKNVKIVRKQEISLSIMIFTQKIVPGYRQPGSVQRKHSDSRYCLQLMQTHLFRNPDYQILYKETCQCYGHHSI